MQHRFDVNKSRPFRVAKWAITTSVAAPFVSIFASLMDANVQKAAADRHWDLMLTKLLAAVVSLPWVTAFWFWIPLSILAGIGTALWTADLWLEWFFPAPKSDLRIHFDPMKWNFARLVREDFVPGCDYYVVVTNIGVATLENVSVTYSNDNELIFHETDGPNGVSLDPGETKFFKLFHCAMFEEFEGDMMDPRPFSVRVRATARNSVPSPELTLDFQSSGTSLHGEEGGPYKVTIV